MRDVLPSAEELATVLPDPFLLVSRTGRVLAANPAARRWLGLGSGPLGDLHLAQVVTTPPAALDALLATFARSRSLVPAALSWRTPAGIAADARCDGGLLRPRSGDTDAVLVLRFREKREATVGFVALNEQVAALTRQVAARRRAEADLLAQREWLRVTLSSIGDAVIAADRGGAVTFMNTVAEHMTGWSSAEAAGRPLAEVFRIMNERTRQEVDNPVAEVLRRGAVVGLANHTVLVARDGTERPIEDSAAPIRDAEGRILGVILVFHDVTARRQTETAREELLRREQAARAEAEAAVRARDVFLARASHELRTPLTSALGSIRLLGGARAGRLREPPSALVEIARRNLDAMLTLINSLLDASKLTAGEERLEIESVDLALAVDACLQALDGQAREKGVEMTNLVPAGLAVAAEPLKLEQVLVNLLANAVNFTPAGGSVSVEAQAADGGTLIAVRDTGEGIPTEHLTAIFEPFFQARVHAARRPRGTGLGLAISRQIVTLHGGRIWAESEGLGAGSVFRVWLPARAEAV